MFQPTEGMIVWFVVVLLLLAVWETVWKSIAMWKAAGRKQLAWFICIFVINTAGILPIVYLLFFDKK